MSSSHLSPHLSQARGGSSTSSALNPSLTSLSSSSAPFPNTSLATSSRDPVHPNSSPSSRSSSPSSRGEADVDFELIEDEMDATGFPDDDLIMAASTPASSSLGSNPSKRKLNHDNTNGSDAVNGSTSHWVRRSGRQQSSRHMVASSDSDSDSDIDTRKAVKRRKNVAAQTSQRATPAARASRSDSEESDEDFESNRQKQRRKYQNKNMDAEAFAEARNPARRTAQPKSYIEDDDELIDEDEVAEWKFTDDTSPTGPAVGEVLDYRRIGHNDERPFMRLPGDAEEAAPEKSEFEYLIRAQGKAHYTAEWLSSADILAMEGNKRLVNFYNKIVVPEWDYYNNEDVSAEDKEASTLARTERLEKLDEHTVVERVVDQQVIGGEIEYFIKWKGLNYDSCTWEEAAYVSAHASDQIDRYLARISSPMISNKEQSNPVTRRQHKESYFLAKKQPDFIKKGTLRDFQLKGLDFLATNWCKNENIILADEMGLGKTVQTIVLLNWLRHERGQQGPFLVIVPLSTMPAWAMAFDDWTPDLNYVVYQGKQPARQIIREKELFESGNINRPKFNVLLTTYEFIMADAHLLSNAKWQYLAVDEAHRLKNPKSNLYIKLQQFNTANRLLITGTPVQNNLSELRALMEFLNPGRDIVADDIDYEATNASDRLADLNDRIKPFLLRRTKAQVLSDLPEKKEKIIRLGLSDMQLEYYKNILARNYEALTRVSKGERYSLNNIMVELKKASNHPFLFPGAEEHQLGDKPTPEEEIRGLVISSGKMMLLDQLLPKLKRDGHRVLIFSQFVGMLDILGDYLSKRNHQFQRLDGNIGTGARNAAINHFNAPDSEDFAFLLSTRAGGLGINLATADTVIIFDSDWNPQADLQAMARAHRIGQKKPVTVFRLVSRDTIEEEILERARNKLMLEYITIQRNIDPKKLDDKISKQGLNINADAPSSSEDISRLLKKRGQKMFEQKSDQKSLEELDIDNVLANAEEHETKQAEGLGADGGDDFLKNFEVTDIKLDEKDWGDIIPREDVERMRKVEEEKRKKELEKKARDQDRARSKRKAVEDADEDDSRDARAAKKRARDFDMETRRRQEEDNDPNRPLSKEEIKALVEAQLRWGYFDERQDTIVKEAGLEDRNITILKRCIDDVHQIAEQKLAEEQDRLNAIISSGSTVLKKDQKSVLFDYKGAFSGKQLNAETVVQRTKSLHILKRAVDKWTEHHDAASFRVQDVHNTAKWTAAWGPEEDGRLCVGVARYGYNGWKEMEEDDELLLKGHMYLSEHHLAEINSRKGQDGKVAPPRTPGSVHLGRRVEYLCMVLRDASSKGTDAEASAALQNYHRSNRRPGGGAVVGSSAASRSGLSVMASGSPAPAGPSRRGGPERPSSNGLDKGRHHRLPSSSGDRSQSPRVPANNGYASLKSAKRGRDESGLASERPLSSRREDSQRNAQNGFFEAGHKRVKTPPATTSTPDATGRQGSTDPHAEKVNLLRKVVEEFKELHPRFKEAAKPERVPMIGTYLGLVASEIGAHCAPKGADFERSCWDLVASRYWLGKGASGDALRAMAAKLPP